MSICTVIQQRVNKNNVVGKMSDGFVITDNALILPPLSREHTSFTYYALSLCIRHRILCRLFCLLFINSTQPECNQTRTNITSRTESGKQNCSQNTASSWAVSLPLAFWWVDDSREASAPAGVSARDCAPPSTDRLSPSPRPWTRWWAEMRWDVQVTAVASLCCLGEAPAVHTIGHR